MTKVLVRTANYEEKTLRPLIEEMLGGLSGGPIAPGTKVLVKPNLLLASRPERAIVTHPMVARSVVRCLLDRGARVQVSDSPPLGSFHKLIRETGYAQALEGLDVGLRAFEFSTLVDIGEPFGRIEMAKEVTEADLIINLAKLKTHAQMFLTLGVKNTFGCIVGLRKPEWHLRAGVDRRIFARLLVKIYEAVAPAYTIVDGILSLEGQGPGKSGRPRELGLLVGGVNAHAVDKTVCSLLGLDPAELLTHTEARALGVFDGVVHVSGDFHIVSDFVFPELAPLSLGPETLSRFMRKYVIQKPVADNKLCKLCGECWQICPAKVISHDMRGIAFNYDGCIRCYCCLEVCPHGAIRAKEPLLGRLRRRFVQPGAV